MWKESIRKSKADRREKMLEGGKCWFTGIPEHGRKSQWISVLRQQDGDKWGKHEQGRLFISEGERWERRNYQANVIYWLDWACKASYRRDL